MPLPVTGTIDVLTDAGDTDSDGRRDLGVGLSRANQGLGALVVLSGRGLTTLLNLSGAQGRTLGTTLVSVGDYDGDGGADFAANTQGPWVSGYLLIYSGRTGAVITALSQVSGVAQPRLAIAGDVNADGTLDLIAVRDRLGTYGIDVLSTRRLMLFATHTASVRWGPPPWFTIDAGTRWGSRFYLLLGSASGTRPGMRIGSVQLPLNFDPLLWHTLLQANRPPYASLGLLNPEGQGVAWMAAFYPPREWIGLTIHHAAVLLDVGGAVVAATNAVPLTFVD